MKKFKKNRNYGINGKFSSLSLKQKKQIVIAIIALGIILILLISYLYIIPRTRLTVKTLFNENFSGIAVGCYIKNSGNRDIKDFSIYMEIRNSTKVVMDSCNYSRKLIEPGEDFFTPNLQFYGDQYEEYTIILEIEFWSEDKLYKETIKHTAKDYLNLKWEDKIS